MAQTRQRFAQRVVQAVAARALPAPELARLQRLHVDDAGHGYDMLGMHRDWVGMATAILRVLHGNYFRVTSYGTEHIPRHGPAIFVANHGGLLPIDATMLCMDVFEHTDPPRLLRAVVDFFVPHLPIVSTLLQRIGATAGATGNVCHLLEAGELVLIFPEGMQAIGKPAAQRYRLQGWSVGHAELALRQGVPVVPVAIIGAEEQWPELTRIERLLPFGIPYLPIPLLPFPLPVHYHIHYGTPLNFAAAHAQPSPALVDEAASASQAAVAALLARGLQMRSSVFR